MRRSLENALETGAFGGPIARFLSSIWAGQARVHRTLTWHESLRTVGVGGATLGGSGKTSVALELARRAPPGERVCIVTRSYPHRLPAPRRVSANDDASRVGDEAVMLARALAGRAVEVWVGQWQSVLDSIGAGGGVVILDGVLQTTPRPLDCSVLSLEATAPWGSGHCPPAGDLAASPTVLLGAADLVLLHHGADPGGELDEGAVESSGPWPGSLGSSAFDWTHALVGVRTPDGTRIPAGAMASMRLGLLLAIGRPGRVVRELAALGINPAAMHLSPDHGRFPPASRVAAPPLDAWLTTAKCATKLESYYGGTPVWVLERGGRFPEPVVARCFGRGSRAAREAC